MASAFKPFTVGPEWNAKTARDIDDVLNDIYRRLRLITPGNPGRDGVDGATIHGMDGEDGEPGQPGPQGVPGTPGNQGVDRIVEDGETRTLANEYSAVVIDYFAVEGSGVLAIEGDAALGIIGSGGHVAETGTVGPTGPTGATGAAGPITVGPMGLNGEDGEPGWPIPGPKGDTGATGPAGGDWDVDLTKTADFDVVNSTTLDSDPELTFAVLTGETWMIEAIIAYAGNGGGVDMRASAAFPTAFGNYLTLSTTAADAASSVAVRVASATSLTTLTCGTRSTIDLVEVCRLLICLSFQGDGDFVIQQANQNAGVGNTTRLKAGSILRAKQLI